MKVTLICTNSDMCPGIAALQCHNKNFNMEDANKSGNLMDRVIDSCIQRGHTSVIEHFYVSFLIEGLSLAAIQQLLRHRIASYTQRSLRYTEVDGVDWFFVPDEIKNNQSALAQYINHMNQCMDTYKFLLKQGVHKETARYVLPVATTSNIVMTINARSLQNFFGERLCVRAQKEIRDLAFEMKRVLETQTQFFALNKIATPKCKSCTDKCPQKAKENNK